ncbi:LexA repressor [Arsenophonus endosymbiont of Bemisia tabaci Q2]|nr:LexA repressor [Arsenophonus endosymbiont of Bemisia tabaci Q2]
MKELTLRQQQVYDLVREHISQTGMPPTRAEIASSLGFRSPNAAEEHLKALARKRGDKNCFWRVSRYPATARRT